MPALAAASPADRYFVGAYGNSRPALGLPVEGATPSAGGEVAAPIALSPAYAECDCTRTECFDRAVGLPAGWRPAADGSRVECPDCASSSRLVELHQAGADQVSRLFTMKGFRLVHELHPRIRVATLRLHAGAAAAPHQVDRIAPFVADRADIADLIAQLVAIDLELAAAAATPRT